MNLIRLIDVYLLHVRSIVVFYSQLSLWHRHIILSVYKWMREIWKCIHNNCFLFPLVFLSKISMMWSLSLPMIMISWIKVCQIVEVPQSRFKTVPSHWTWLSKAQSRKTLWPCHLGFHFEWASWGRQDSFLGWSLIKGSWVEIRIIMWIRLQVLATTRLI